MSRRGKHGEQEKELEPGARQWGDARFQRGRQPLHPFSQLPDWAGCAEISPGAKALYWALRMHVNQQRKDRAGDLRVWPGQRRLLAISRIRSKTTLRKYLCELRAITAVEWETGRQPRNPLRALTVYTVHEVPEDRYTGPRSMDDVPDEDEEGDDA